MFGLKDSDIKELYGALAKHSQVEEAVMFGSRVKGNYRPGSDVDIALKGKDLSGIVLELSTYLNQESVLPYKFDLIDYASVDSDELKSHIDRIGIKFYPTLPE